MSFNNTEEFGWDSIIEHENDFVVLKPGVYDFTITKFERGYYNGSDKLPACNKAILTVNIKATEGEANIKHNLFVSRKTEGLLCQFFLSIGQKEHDKPLRMDWNKVVGSTGKCEVGVRQYNGNDYNEIKKFLEPVKAAPTSHGFTPGQF